MEPEFCILEKPWSYNSNSHGTFHNVINLTFRPFNFFEDLDEPKLLYWRFFNHFFKQNLYDTVEVDLGIEKFKAQRYVAWIHALQMMDAKIQLAYDGSRCVGFMTYHDVCPGVIYIRAMMCEPYVQGNKVGIGLIKSLNKNVKRVLFETIRDVFPEYMMEKIKRCNKLSSNEKMDSWEMKLGD